MEVVKEEINERETWALKKVSFLTNLHRSPRKSLHHWFHMSCPLKRELEEAGKYHTEFDSPVHYRSSSSTAWVCLEQVARRCQK